MKFSNLIRGLSTRDKAMFLLPLIWITGVIVLALAAPLITMRVQFKEVTVNAGLTTGTLTTSTSNAATPTSQPSSAPTSVKKKETRLVAVDPIIPIPGLKLKPWDRSYETVQNPPGSRLIGQGPTTEHWLGTDELGRDILSRLVWGSRVALAVGFVSVFVALFIGGTVGMLAGFLRGKTELVLMTLIGSLLAFPALILVVAIVAFLGHDLINIVFAIAVIAIPSFARIAYANTLAASQKEYVLAARALGASRSRILLREILPNIILPLSAFALVVTAVAIVAEGGLSFLGLSVSAPRPSWGSMINDGRKLLTLEGKWHLSFIPAITMFLTVLSLNIAGDWIRRSAVGQESKI